MEEEFTAGSFIVLKSDFAQQGEPPIWKIDGKSLLQKFLPFQKDGKTLYKNTTSYSGWSEDKKDLYYLAPVIYKQQNRSKCIVEFFPDKVGIRPSGQQTSMPSTQRHDRPERWERPDRSERPEPVWTSLYNAEACGGFEE